MFGSRTYSRGPIEIEGAPYIELIALVEGGNNVTTPIIQTFEFSFVVKDDQ